MDAMMTYHKNIKFTTCNNATMYNRLIGKKLTDERLMKTPIW